MTQRRSRYRARAKPKPRTSSEYEEAFALQLRVAGLPAPEREFVFHPLRKWRFDFAWPEQFVAAEVEGGGADLQGSGGRTARFRHCTGGKLSGGGNHRSE